MMSRPFTPFRVRPLRALTPRKPAGAERTKDALTNDNQWSSQALRKPIKTLLIASATRDRSHVRSLPRTIA
jgi:hypothetical protein